MDIEFHFYITQLIAQRAGFSPEDSRIIAYSSQYTDDNVDYYTVIGGPEPYNNYISQTMDITTPQEDRLWIYPLFHFCPGTPEETFKNSPMRNDNTKHVLNTIPDNSNARYIFDQALKSRDLYRIGIATHMYADTFCHRDFVGWKDNFNWIDGICGELTKPLAIGHALAMHNPDIPNLIWTDSRLTTEYQRKINKEQILAAAGNIFDFFCKIKQPPKAAKEQLLGDLGAAIGEPSEDECGKDERIKNYVQLLGIDYFEYDEMQWFADAVDDTPTETESKGESEVTEEIYSWKDKYSGTDWFKFQEAVKLHHELAFAILKPNLDQMHIDKSILD